MTKYIAILSKDEDSSFGVHFPDLPGCVSAGETEEDAIANAAIALRLWSEGRDSLPTPSSMAILRNQRDAREDLAAGGIAVLVPLITAGRKQKLNIALDHNLLKAADAAAAAAGVSRSRFIESTLEGALSDLVGAARVDLANDDDGSPEPKSGRAGGGTKRAAGRGS